MSKKIYFSLAAAIIIILAIIGIAKTDLIKKETIEKDLAISQEMAKTIFLRDILKPETLGANIIAFMYPRPLTEKDKISPYLPDPLPDSISQAPYLDEDAFSKITSPQWFFWVDKHPFAKYAHPTQFVFLDGQTGSFTLSEEMWWPMLNGEIIWDDDNYWSQEDWIYSNLKNEEQKTSSNFNLGKIISGLPTLSRPNLALAEDSSQNEEKNCLLVINGWKKGQTGEQDHGIDQKEMERVFKGKMHKIVSLGPGDKIGDILMQKIEELADECDDVIIYIGSHGAKYKDGTDTLNLGGFILKDTFLSLYLQSLAKDYPKVKFKIIIDACYSGSFIDQLKKAGNVVLVITASAANEFSYQDVEESLITGNWKPDPNPQDEGCEFSSGLTEDIQEILADKKKTEELKGRIKKNSTSFEVELLKEAFKSAVAKDFCVINGLTHPQIYEKPKSEEKTAPAKETTPKPKSEAVPKEESTPPTETPPLTPALNQKPIISTINVIQLHLNYEDTPHKYNLTAEASDPDNNLPLSYSWSIDCGFIFSSATANPIEWHYNLPGECINAKATITVTDSLGAKSSLTQLLFP